MYPEALEGNLLPVDVTPCGGTLLIVLGAGGVAGAAVDEFEAAEEVDDFSESLTGTTEGVSGAVGTLFPTEPLEAGMAGSSLAVVAVAAMGVAVSAGGAAARIWMGTAGTTKRVSPNRRRKMRSNQAANRSSSAAGVGVLKLGACWGVFVAGDEIEVMMADG